ncbi:hypothetical protein [Paractinoplanes atraurantiacus]|uniref:Uncharacterized protein n=1 Tax=Paractinoplanes atraurantiacus TaxID=1036182 RepID=A0A285KAY4_9ACTN|nr:hypothetical protein [Actinoplanes atraurantiacus]SNY69760.1 hypothetical protein SAMN05421748_1364 [Actinoplanes atraurantiacus]
MNAPAFPRWIWIAAGVIVAAYGVVLDRFPDYARTYGTTLVILATVLALAGTRRSRPRVRPDRAIVIAGVAGALVLVGGMLAAGVLHVSHVALAIGLAGGLLLAVAGPWWQRRVLAGR